MPVEPQEIEMSDQVSRLRTLPRSQQSARTTIPATHHDEETSNIEEPAITIDALLLLSLGSAGCRSSPHSSANGTVCQGHSECMQARSEWHEQGGQVGGTQEVVEGDYLVQHGGEEFKGAHRVGWWVDEVFEWYEQLLRIPLKRVRVW